MGKEVKTNAVRILERNKVPYELLTYECDEFIDGIHSAEATGTPVAQTYKTLVMQGKSKKYYVFVIPIAEEVDLKAAARAGGFKGGSKSGRREIRRNDPCQRFNCNHWLCPWRLQSSWHEKSISNRYRCLCQAIF